jgi:peptidoglycan LD-endopeptidase CwlK
MTYRLGKKSQEKLSGVHPDLIRVISRAIEITEIDFTVLEGLRSKLRQRVLFDKGATTTMNSRHITGHAVDLGAWVGGGVRWDWCLYHKISSAMNQASEELNIKIEWGGNWKSFPDGPHFQLPWSEYPLGDQK